MRRIYKWPLTVPLGGARLPWSSGDQVLMVAEQHHELMLWAEQEDSNPNHGHRQFAVVGTGYEAPVNGQHVGSAVCGEFVWHVYAGPIESAS